MKTFFTCSTNSILKHEKYYRAIRNEIISQGNEITRDWIDYSINLAKRNTKESPAASVYEDVMSAILTADAIIAEVTVKSMPLGHQITYALSKGKPVLLLRAKKGGQTNDKLFIEGSLSSDLTISYYSSVKDIPLILKRFFSKFDNVLQKRFNLVLTGAQDSYLAWAAYNYKKNKTEIIHDSLGKQMERDPVYKKYLSRQS